MQSVHQNTSPKQGLIYRITCLNGTSRKTTPRNPPDNISRSRPYLCGMVKGRKEECLNISRMKASM